MQPHNSRSAGTGISGPNTPARPCLGGPTVAVFNIGLRALGRFESMPEFARYNLLILNSRTGAYGDIKRLRPSLVVVGAGLEDDACELLTLLKFDNDTRHIPIVTIATDPADCDAGDLEWALLVATRN